MHLRRLVTILLLVAMSVFLQAHQGAGKRWAILIGIDSYEDKALAPLQFAVADAKLMEKALTEAGFDRVVTLTSDSSDPAQQPKRATILARLAQMSELIQPDDTFLFYFAGHGFSDDKTKQSYLTTSDCQSSLLKETGLPMELLQDRMEQVKALHRVFMIDACRNDPFKGGRGASNVRNKDLSRDLIQAAAAAPVDSKSDAQLGTAVLWACSLGERSWEVEDKGHGAFTYFLAQGLESGAAAEKDGSVSPYSLISYVQDQMEQWSLKKGKKQRPDWQSEGKAKFPLALARSSKPVSEPPVKPTNTKVPLTASLSVVSTPSGATVYIDDKEVGTTPFSKEIDLSSQSSRKLTIVVKKDGFKADAVETTMQRGVTNPVSFTLVALPKPEPTKAVGMKLRRVPTVGQKTKYQIRTTFEIPDLGTAEMKADAVEEIVGLTDSGDYTTMMTTTNGRLIAPGGEVSQVPMEGPSYTDFNSLGRPIAASDNEDPNAMRYAMLQAIVMSEGPVKPGDSWKHTFPSGGGAVAGTGSYKFEGEEKVGGYACLKFTANYRETSGAAPASMTGTFWINSKDFTLVKFVGSMKNAPVPEVGPLDLKLWITRDGLK